MCLSERVKRLQRTAILDVPEGPAIARRRVLERGSDLVDRAAVRAARKRAVRAYAGDPAALRIKELRPGRHEATFYQQTEGDTRLLALVGHCLHRTLVERKHRIDPLAGDLDIGTFALDPDPVPAEPAGNRSSRACAEERVENHIAGLRTSEKDSVQQSLRLLRRMSFRPVTVLQALLPGANREKPIG